MYNLITLLFFFAFLFTQCSPEKRNTINLQSRPDSIEIFAPGIIATNLYERDMAISPDGTEMIYTLGDYRQLRRCLVFIKKSGNSWGNKEILNFSGLYDDIEPCFSADGNKLYFVSNRPVDRDSSRTDYNIWVVERTNNGWTDPAALPANINTKGDEFYPSVSSNRNIYFTSVRDNGIGSEDIFISRYINGNYADPEPLDSSVNSGTYEFNAYVTPDERLIVFTSYGRQDDMGGGDLYYSIKDHTGTWMPAVNMGVIVNSDKLDFCPFIDMPRGNFYFTSDRTVSGKTRLQSVHDLEEFANQLSNGCGNIYRISTDAVLPSYTL